MIDSLTLPSFLSLAFLFTCWWIGNCFGMMIDRFLYAEMSMRSANMDPSPYWYNKKTAPSSNDIQIRCFTFEIGDLSNDEKITVSKCFFLRNSSFNRETFIFIKIFIQRKLLSVCDDTCLHFVSNIVLVFFYALIRYTDLPKQKKICCFFLQISKKMFQEKE